MLQNMIIIQQS